MSYDTAVRDQRYGGVHPSLRLRASVRDAETIRRVVKVLVLAPGDRVELSEPRDAGDGSTNRIVDVVVVSPSVPDLQGANPLGEGRPSLAAMNDAARRLWNRDADEEPLSAGRPLHESAGDRRSEASRLRSQNAAARRFWNI